MLPLMKTRSAGSALKVAGAKLNRRMLSTMEMIFIVSSWVTRNFGAPSYITMINAVLALQRLHDRAVLSVVANGIEERVILDRRDVRKSMIDGRLQRAQRFLFVAFAGISARQIEEGADAFGIDVRSQGEPARRRVEVFLTKLAGALLIKIYVRTVDYAARD